jgi:crotonobetainyl-CoA:carnitine CoA-transferase CaiB-like acyl-CoA transferase
MTSNAQASASTPAPKGALHGLKVVEFAQLLAGPFAGSLLADLGADVVHVEDPGRGDPMRTNGLKKDGTYLWWKVSGRNKRSVTLDLRQPAGQDVARELAAWADVVITNMRPGTLDKWGLNWPSFHAVNPRLVMLQVSGFGVATSRRDEPGYGKLGEARSGVVQITGFPDGPPVHAGFSHADTVTGLMGAFAIQAAVYRQVTDPDFEGEWIDLGIDESLFRMIEWQIVNYDQLGIVAERVGNGIPGAPDSVVNAYRSTDGRWITISARTVPTIQSLARLSGCSPADFASKELFLANKEHLDKAITAWIGRTSSGEVLAALKEVSVVAAPVLDAAQIVGDPSYQERGNILTVDDPDLGPLRMQGVIPRLHNYRGDVWQLAPALGEHNDDVYRGMLKFDDGKMARLRQANVIT